MFLKCNLNRRLFLSLLEALYAKAQVKTPANTVM